MNHGDIGRLPLSRLALVVLWPAFVMAGVLEMLIFVVADPQDFAWFGGAPLGWSRQAVYTVTFFILWAVLAVSGALTVMFAHSAASERISSDALLDEALD